MTKAEDGDVKRTVTRLQTGGKADGRIVRDVEKFINDYVAFADNYSFPIALWIVATYVFPSFDAFPYMVITADTKRSGKSRLAEMISFCCSNPRFFTAMTPSTMFNIIEAEHPVVIFDEAETLSSESQGVMTQVLNAGYRKGTKIPRMTGKDQWKEYDTYSPKVFVLIGDVRDTLRDRSVIVRMKRMDTPTRFVHEIVKARGAELRDTITSELEPHLQTIAQAYMDFKGIEFLTDRDEEIWSPLFVLANILCPERLPELSRIAVDMATEKTIAKRHYVNMAESEDAAQDDEYKLRLLSDLLAIMQGKSVSSQDAVNRLRDLPTAPWRKFRGDGITMHNIADMLSQFGIRPVPIRVNAGSGKTKTSKVFKGYKLEAVRLAVRKHSK